MAMMQIAASTGYETTPSPPGVPEDMQPLPGAHLRFLSIEAIDGFRVAAALWQPDQKTPANTTLLVQVHGSGGNDTPLGAEKSLSTIDRYTDAFQRSDMGVLARYIFVPCMQIRQ